MKLLIHINSLGLGGAERVTSILAEYLASKGHQVTFVTEWRDTKEYPLPDGVMRIHAGLPGEDQINPAGQVGAEHSCFSGEAAPAGADSLSFGGTAARRHEVKSGESFSEDHRRKAMETGKKPGRLSAAYARLKNLRRIIKAEKPDLVLSFMKKANYRAVFAMSFLSVPLVISVRNDPAVDYTGRAAGLLNAFMKKKASGGVFQTHPAMDFFGKGFAARSSVILNPVEERFFHASWEGGEERIVSIGRLTAQKNQMLLLKAFARIAGHLPHRLELYGAPDPQGEAASALKRYVQEQGLQNRVFFMGTTAHPEEVLSHSACFVLSSDYEGLPNALLEALCMGVPCISTNCPCGGPAEVIENNENGLLIPVGDEEALAKAMERVLNDQAFARRLSENALLLRDRLSTERICGEWEKYLELRSYKTDAI